MTSRTSRLATVVAAAALAVAASAGTVLAHAYPKTYEPRPNARLDTAPAHIGITYDSPISAQGSSMLLMDSTGSVVPVAADVVDGSTRTSISPLGDLAPGPYTVAWTTLSAEDGHTAQGFYTFAVNGGPVGIVNGAAQSQTAAADLTATLTVTAADDGSSLLRVNLDNRGGVERVRIRLSRPDLGDDLLDTVPSGDSWLLSGNEVAVPGGWHAQVIVRRQNIFDDAQGGFDFSVDPVTGTPAFASAQSVPTYNSAIIYTHAQYASSTPAANATLPAAPSTVQVTWTQELAAIQLTITGPDGSDVVNGPAKINLAERHTASVPTRDAGPGQYLVLWHNVSGDDGDPNDGSFVFTVAGAAPQPAATTASPPAAGAIAQPADSQPTRAPTCVENGVITPGIADVRVNTYCKRQAIREQYKGKINELVFNFDLSIGMGFESSLKDALGGGG